MTPATQNAGFISQRKVIMCFYNGEYPEFQSTAIRKCRKPSRCECCSKIIEVGQQYECSSGLFDGSFYTVKTCNLCVQDRLRIVKYELVEGSRWQDAWPNTDEQAEWFNEHPRVKRAASRVELNAAYAKLESFWKRIRERQAVGV